MGCKKHVKSVTTSCESTKRELNLLNLAFSSSFPYYVKNSLNI